MCLSRWSLKEKFFGGLNTTVRLNLYLEVYSEVNTVGQEKALEVTGGRIHYAFTYNPHDVYFSRPELAHYTLRRNSGKTFASSFAHHKAAITVIIKT